MLALWALFLLSAMIISWTLDIDSQLTFAGRANRVLEAEAMACSGAEVALHPLVKSSSPNLRGQFSNRQSYEAHLTGEAGRLNLNYIVAKILAGDPRNQAIFRETLQNFLQVKGVDFNERDHMIDCLLDWVDPDNLVRLNGAEDSEDYHPPNKGTIVRLDELKKVKGWLEFTATPGWDDDLTLATTTGKVDPNWASRDVLMSLPGMNDAIVDSFLKLRRGPDEIDWTEDDLQFKDMEGLRVALRLNPQQFGQFAELIGVGDPVFRVVSVGKSSEVTRTVQMVFRRQGTTAVLIPPWREL